jgi:hypothetical protein
MVELVLAGLVVLSPPELMYLEIEPRQGLIARYFF